MRFLQNHKDNYGAASCKPENSTLMKQIFCQLQKALFLKIFQAFPQKYNFFLNLLELSEFEAEWYFHMYKVCQPIKGTNHFHKFTVATRS